MDKETKILIVGNPKPDTASLIEQLFKEDDRRLIIVDEIDKEPFTAEQFKKLSDAGLKASEAANNFSKIMSLIEMPFKIPAYMQDTIGIFNKVFSGRTPWAPLHGIQAKFFRFNPKKWHTACARFIPTGHRVTYFYRRCWMSLKAYRNFRFLRPA